VCCFKRIVEAPVLPPIGIIRKSKRGGKWGYFKGETHNVYNIVGFGTL